MDRGKLLRSAVGMTHDLRSDLWLTIPFRILLGQFWDTLRIPHDQANPSQTHRCPGVFGSRQSDHVIIIGTYHILPMGIHGLCFGYCFSGPLPLRSLILGPLSRVHFGESLVIRLYSEIDHTYLSIEAQCVSHHYPGGLPQWENHSCLFIPLGVIFFTYRYLFMTGPQANFKFFWGSKGLKKYSAPANLWFVGHLSKECTFYTLSYRVWVYFSICHEMGKCHVGIF